MRTCLYSVLVSALVTAASSCGGSRNGGNESSNGSPSSPTEKAAAPAVDYSKETNPDVLLDAMEKRIADVEAAARAASPTNTPSMEAYAAAMEKVTPIQTRLGELMDADKLNMGQISRNLRLTAQLSHIAGIPLGMGGGMTPELPAEASATESAEIDAKLSAFEAEVAAMEAEAQKVLQAEGGKSAATQQGKHDAAYDARKRAADQLYDDLLDMNLSPQQMQRLSEIQRRQRNALFNRYSNSM